jgi:alpha-tubulin suppressor-like RCC1 family protein
MGLFPLAVFAALPVTAADSVQSRNFSTTKTASGTGTLVVSDTNPSGSNGLLGTAFMPFDPSLGTLTSFTINWSTSLTASGTVSPSSSGDGGFNMQIAGNFYLNSDNYSGAGGGGGKGAAPGAVITPVVATAGETTVFQVTGAGTAYNPAILTGITGTSNFSLSFLGGYPGSPGNLANITYNGLSNLTSLLEGSVTLTYTYTPTSSPATYNTPTSQVLGGWVNGGSFTVGTVNTHWPSAESPDKAVDNNTGSKFLAFRNNNAGLILSPTNATLAFNRLLLSTANDSPERDPASYVIYGSPTVLSGAAGANLPLSGLTLLASGTITLPDNRTTGPTVVQFANTTPYASYIVAFPTVRSTTGNNITQISEVQLSQGINPPHAVAMAGARGGQLSGGTFTFGSIGSNNPGTNWLANESPDQAIDGSVSTKYLIFRNTGAGLIASPQAGPARVNNLSFWTANDSAERDPLTYEVYGFATAVTARSGTLNVTTNGTLLGSGTLTLPATRNAGPVNVAFANSTEYASYLVVFPTVKNSPSTTMMQIAEVQFGYNGLPDFSISSPVVNLNENSGPQSYAAFATDITAGLGDVGQTVSFTCTNDNNALFSAQPAIATNGTLTFTTSTNSYGSAVVTVVATDNLGSSSEPKTFNVEVAIVPLISRSPSLLGDFTAVTGNASSSQSFVVNARALSGPVVVIAPSGFEVSTDNSNFSSSLTLSTKPGTIDSIYGGSFNIASGRIWNSGNGMEFPNFYAFAAITSSGSVVAWGDARYGGNTSAVANNLTSNVMRVHSNIRSFAALKTDGSIVTWGEAGSGGNSASVANKLTSNVTVVYSTERAYAALKTDGSVVTWGDAGYGGDSAAVASSLTSNVKTVYSNTKAFAALKKDGSVVTWGDTNNGGNSTSVAASLTSGVTAVYSTGSAFAALKGNGSVVTWGNNLYGGDSTAVAAKLTSNVTAVYSTGNAFAALKTDGSVVTWGDYLSGGYSADIASNLATNVAAIYSTIGAFAALKTDGSVVSWGFSPMGGNSTAVANSLASNVVEVYSTGQAFAALKNDGSVVTWGGDANGGDSTTVASSLTSNVTAVYSTGFAFAALKTDRSLVIWGNTSSGGDASAVAGNLTSNVASVYSTYAAFAALKTDGSVFTWGISSYGGVGGPVNIGVNSMPATVYTRLSPTAPTGSVIGNLSLESSGAQPQTVALSGTVTSQPSYTHLEQWRFANFGSYDSVNSGADSADPDGDGLSNLMEYALGLSPNNSGVIPAALSLSGANLEYTYTRSTAAKDNGVTYQIEWSDTLEAGSWSTETVAQQITSTEGALESVKASVPAGTGGKRFLRLRVGAAPLQTP